MLDSALIILILTLLKRFQRDKIFSCRWHSSKDINKWLQIVIYLDQYNQSNQRDNLSRKLISE